MSLRMVLSMVLVQPYVVNVMKRQGEKRRENENKDSFRDPTDARRMHDSPYLHPVPRSHRTHTHTVALGFSISGVDGNEINSFIIQRLIQSSVVHTQSAVMAPAVLHFRFRGVHAWHWEPWFAC